MDSPVIRPAYFRDVPTVGSPGVRAGFSGFGSETASRDYPPVEELPEQLDAFTRYRREHLTGDENIPSASFSCW